MSDTQQTPAGPSLQPLVEPLAPGRPPRKRKRRTIACTQCRCRKLRCDREYPICGRCQKSKTPADCTYEDGFLWQHPSTVSSTTLPDQGSTAIAQDRTPVRTPPEPALTPSLPGPQRGQPSVADRPPRGEKRDRFLETVLGAPKAAFNPDPSAGAPRRPSEGFVPTEHMEGNQDGDLLASPSQHLDITPRIMLRGKETRTRFNGSGIFANLMAQVVHLL